MKMNIVLAIAASAVIIGLVLMPVGDVQWRFSVAAGLALMVIMDMFIVVLESARGSDKSGWV